MKMADTFVKYIFIMKKTCWLNAFSLFYKYKYYMNTWTGITVKLLKGSVGWNGQSFVTY